jgi:hypothetical protein
LKCDESKLKENKWYDLDLVPNDLEFSDQIQTKLDSTTKTCILQFQCEEDSKFITIVNFMELKYSIFIISEK